MATKAAKLAKAAERESILDYFAELPDPRREGQNKRHKLINIITISTLATICGAEHFTEMEVYAEANEEFLKTILELPNGCYHIRRKLRTRRILRPRSCVYIFSCN